VLRLSAVTQVARDPDSVFHQLHDPQTLLSCVPGGSLTRLIDSRTFEARIAIGAGPFKVGYAGRGSIVTSDPRSRTASMVLNAEHSDGVPALRIRMAMAIHSRAKGSEIRMTFRVAVPDHADLLTRAWVDPIACDLLDRTVRRLKQRLEDAPMSPLPPAA
jgi:carbon monoxide dehydrogenase subunit G